MNFKENKMFEKEEQKEKELIEFLTNNGVKIAPLGNGDVSFLRNGQTIAIFGDWDKSYNKNIAILTNVVEEVKQWTF